MLTVEKIGGSSMSMLDKVIENIIINRRKEEQLYNRVFVVSAFGGITDLLLENKKTGKPGVYHRIEKHQDFHKQLEQVLTRLKEINQEQAKLGLDVEAADRFIECRILKLRRYLDHLSSVQATGYVAKQGILLAAREILASIGEVHSAFNLSNILENMGIKTSFIDLSGFGDNRPLTIDHRIKSTFKELELKKCISIVTGYTKGSDGIMREFDRGYSEVTFSKIAALLRPEEAIIHKEYHLSTADPGIVGIANCVPVGFTNYDIADQLADVGMEAIHPKAAKPLEIAGINLRIKNTFEPGHPGTLITKDFICQKKRVEVITGSDKLLIIDIFDPLMVGTVGSDLKAMEVFAHHQISYSFKSTSANSISVVIWEKECKNQLIKELETIFERITVEKTALVCLMGSNIDQPGLLARAATALAEAGINIKSAGFALRKVNIQFLVGRESFKASIIALNNAMK